MTFAWPLPAPFISQAGDDTLVQDWLVQAPTQVAQVAKAWGLAPDGAPTCGFMSCIWPARRPDGSAAILKVGPRPDGARREASALRAWGRVAPDAAVRLLDADERTGALLLERLDSSRDLTSEPNAELATALIAGLLADVRRPAPSDLPSLTDHLDRIVEAIHRNHALSDAVLPAAMVDRALGALADAHDAAAGQTWLTHTDAHYLNVLHTGSDESQPWRLIDPIPFSGCLEIEPIALLRNRFDDASATGDPERSLRRRLDIMVEALDLDRSLARGLAGAVAVDNLLWLLPREPDHMFVEPYRVLVAWL